MSPFLNGSLNDRSSSCGGGKLFATLYMRRHFVPAESESVGYVRVVVSMRLVKALDMSQIVCERLRIEVRKRLPDLIPRTLLRCHYGDHRISRKSVFSRKVDL